jgi:phage-related tail fiber protein
MVSSSSATAAALLLLTASANAFSVQQQQQHHRTASSSFARRQEQQCSPVLLSMTAQSIDTKNQVKVGVIGALQGSVNNNNMQHDMIAVVCC